MRTGLVCLVGIAMVVGAVGCGQDKEETLNAPEASPEETIQAKPGDVVTRGGVSVIVPERGEGVEAEATLDDGTVRAVRVETRADGTVILQEEGTGNVVAEQVPPDDDAMSAPVETDVPFEDADAGAAERYGASIQAEAEAVADEASPLEVQSIGRSADALGAASSAACTQGGWATAGYRWPGAMNWYFNPRYTPRNLGARAAEIVVSRATSNITGARNDCGLPDRVSAAHAYKGRTTRAANVNANGGCTTRDRRNVVSWGSLPSRVLGVTCSWYIGADTVESDTRMTTRTSFYAQRTVPSGCRNQTSLEAMMTHERGHAYGLKHSDGSAQTMYPSVRACTSAGQTLGNGDIEGLERLY